MCKCRQNQIIIFSMLVNDVSGRQICFNTFKKKLEGQLAVHTLPFLIQVNKKWKRCTALYITKTRKVTLLFYLTLETVLPVDLKPTRSTVHISPTPLSCCQATYIQALLSTVNEAYSDRYCILISVLFPCSLPARAVGAVGYVQGLQSLGATRASHPYLRLLQLPFLLRLLP